jgi:biopolymer transport protein ExbB/TolQ
MSPGPFPHENSSRKSRQSILSRDFLIKNFALLVSIVAVWMLYSSYIRPAAEYVAAESRLRAAQDPEFTAPRTLPVVLKDWEQQVELTLFVWAAILMTLKLRRLAVENRMLGLSYLRLEAGERILPDDALGHYKDLYAEVNSTRSWSERILPNVILSALHRFHATRSIQDAAQSIKERADVAADELEADLSLTRYIVWAIPSVGFVGTVRGIGEALAQAQKALSGDISGVTDALGLAFNSTLVALLLSLVLMFMLHLLQGRQDKLILDIQNFCHDRVVGQMKIPSQESGTPAFQV